MIKISRSTTSVGLDIIYGTLGFTGDNKEELAKIKPLEIPDLPRIPIEDLLSDAIEESPYGKAADTLWDAIQHASRMKDIEFPEGLDLDIIKASIISELSKRSSMSDATIMNELSDAPVVMKAGGGFI